MKKCNKKAMSENLKSVDQFVRIDLDFVPIPIPIPIPVRDEAHKKELLALKDQIIDGMVTDEKWCLA